MPHLRTRTSFNSALLQLRSAAISSVDRYFSELNFVQAHTPIITSSDCEGAGEVFVVAPSDQGLGAADDAKTSDSFFRDPKYLTVSSQLHLEALAQSVGNVWTLSPTFRAERSDTSRHLSEFYMLEAEQSFIDDLSVVMDLLEGMLRHLATDLYEKGLTREILSGSKHHSPDLTPRDEVRERWNGLMAGDWPRITFSDAIDLLRSTQKRFQHPVSWKEGLHAEHEKYLATAVGKGKPVFVTHYPRAMKAFYMRRTPDADPSDEMQPDRSTVECFDLLVPEFCEIAGGSMREHRLKPLLNAMRLKGMAPSESQDSGTDAAEGSAMSTRSAASLDWYLDLRRWGSPPHGGFGLGFDRLLAYLSGVQSIRDIVTFPRWYGRCDC
jgi:asparaginyl-tRNA synthetase